MSTQQPGPCGSDSSAVLGSAGAAPMTREEIDARLASLTDAELAVCLKTAAADLWKAAEDDHDSEWHGACFAAVIVYCQETDLRKRLNSRPPNVQAKPDTTAGEEA
jgi:hypothetical protein